ncbi:hypothetical protein ABID21_000089 [Pseudorhizobium tarimense]|uniref:Transposase n=1 Tax=Pseudorhizobium tarimense TaxID=1079109 RepID=A0ABV2H0Q6_9HYPH|nr:hypothetical protein [Pseudorhizobium tarimense]MCJ8517341.1 hypothetical protein [Pseudorhizobium tarimense]
MAEIVVLNRWREQQRRRPEIMIGRSQGAESAQLLMFTGVRYERLESMSSQPAQKPMMLEPN